MFLIYLLLLLQKHNECAGIQTNSSGNVTGTSNDLSYDSVVSGTQAADKHIANQIDQGSQSIKHGSMNWTKDDLAGLLGQHGYLVKKASEGWPLGVMGDVAYYPEDLLPELGSPQNRRNLLGTKSLWVNGDQETIVPYYYDIGSKADEEVFEKAVKTWSDNTCIKFAKKSPNKCKINLGYAAVCVGNFGGCFSHLGNKYNRYKESQQMSVQPHACEMVAAAHEFGHALGLCHEMARADRDKFIHVLYHHIDLDTNKLTEKDIRGKWYQGSQCNADQMYDAPKPYDSMSLMQYGTSDFAMDDQRPVYLHKNPHYQYMFDYHRKAGYVQSHFDNLVVNMGYKCLPKWKKRCEESGKSVPKCENYGYAGRDCKCICPTGFSGSTCATKTGPMFPVLDRAKTMLDITKEGIVDLKGKGMHDENHNYPLASFTRWQFITVIIRSGAETRISVEVAQNFESVKRYFSLSQSTWLKAGAYECEYGVHVYVGHSEAAKVRVECISSMVNNEPKEYHTVLRSRTNALDIIGVGGWATCYNGGPPVTRKAMEFQFTVSFLDRPEDRLSTKQKLPGQAGGTAEGGTPEGGTEDKAGEAVDKTIRNATKALKQVLKETQASVMVGVVVGLVLLVAAGGGAAYLYKKSKTSGEDGDQVSLASEDHDSSVSALSGSSD